MFTEQEVRDLLSQTHLVFTARAYGKCPNDVTPDELIAHWKRFHNEVHVQFYDVEPHVSDKDPLFV